MAVVGAFSGGGDAGTASGATTPALLPSGAGAPVVGDVPVCFSCDNSGSQTITSSAPTQVLDAGPVYVSTTLGGYQTCESGGLTSGDISGDSLTFTWSGAARNLSCGVLLRAVTATGRVIGTPNSATTAGTINLPTITAPNGSTVVVGVIARCAQTTPPTISSANLTSAGYTIGRAAATANAASPNFAITTATISNFVGGTVGGTSIAIGNTPTGSETFIIAFPAVAGPPVPMALPGRTWLRHFKPHQTPAVPPPAATGTTWTADVAEPFTFTATGETARTTLGDAPATFTFTATGQTTRTTLGQAPATFTLGLTGETARTTLGQASATLTLGLTADATVTKLANVASTFTLNGNADTTRTTLAQAPATFTLGLTADATVAHAGISADVASPFTLTATAQTTRTTLGQVSQAFTFGATGETARTTLAQVSEAFTLTATSAANRTTLADVAEPFTLTLTSAATRTTLGSQAQAFALAFAADATITHASTGAGHIVVNDATGSHITPNPTTGPRISPNDVLGSHASPATGVGSRIAPNDANGSRIGVG